MHPEKRWEQALHTYGGFRSFGHISSSNSLQFLLQAGQLLHEPTVGLDPKERVKFRKLISSFASEKIVLLSTHIVSDIEYIADEIIILKKGRIENTGTIRYLLKDINKCVWECLVPEKEVNRIEQVYTVSNRKYGEDGVVLRLISREKPFANAKQVDPVLEDLYLFYFREGE